MKASINVSKNISVPRVSFNRLWFAIAAVLRWLDRGYDDYDIRLHMGELTRDEARDEIMGDIDNAEQNRLSGEAWSW